MPLPNEEEKETVEFEIDEDNKQPDIPIEHDWSVQQDDLEIEIGPEEAEPTDEMKALVDQLAESNAKLEQVKTSSASDAATKAVSDVVDKLAAKLSPTQQKPAVAQLPQETEEAFAKRINETGYDEGIYKAISEVQDRKNAPIYNQGIQANLYHGRRYIELDPEKKPFLDKYRQEVEQEVMNTTPQVLFNDPTAYEKAYSTVMGRHQEEVINSKLDELVNEKVEKIMAEKLKTVKPDKKRISFTESGGVPAAESKKTVGRLTPQEAATAKAMNISNQEFYHYKQRKLKGGM